MVHGKPSVESRIIKSTRVDTSVNLTTLIVGVDFLIDDLPNNKIKVKDTLEFHLLEDAITVA